MIKAKKWLHRILYRTMVLLLFFSVFLAMVLGLQEIAPHLSAGVFVGIIIVAMIVISFLLSKVQEKLGL